MYYYILCGIIGLDSGGPFEFEGALIAIDHERKEVILMNLNVLAAFIFGSFTELLVFGVILRRRQGIRINTLCIIGLIVLSTFATALTFAGVSGDRTVMELFGTVAGYFFGFVTRSLVLTQKAKAS